MSKKKEEKTVAEQESILGEVKAEMEEKKRKKIKNFVKRQLKEIQNAEDRIAEIKEEADADIEMQRECITDAQEAIQKIEDGNFEDVLDSEDEQIEKPPVSNWTTYATGTDIIATWK